MIRAGLFALVGLFIAAGAASAILTKPLASEPLAFDARTFGLPNSDAPAELWRPAGAGPFPAVLVLHGCGGVGDNERVWASRLVGWGYVAVIVDSFGPRDVGAVCRRPIVPPTLRARDVLNAAAYLRTLPGIVPDHIGIVGFSHGGSTALYDALKAGGPVDGGVQPFEAVVAYYPLCGIPAAQGGFAIDTLILIGANDKAVSTDRCLELVAGLSGTPHAPAIKVYPQAAHEFDGADGNAAAAADSFAMTKAFLAARLKAK